VFGSFLQPQYVPCPECGASVAVGELDEHRCAPDRWIDYQMFQLRAEIATFEHQVAEYLDSTQGRFAQYYARRQRLLAA
jgi:hypothetical protein